MVHAGDPDRGTRSVHGISYVPAARSAKEHADRRTHQGRYPAPDVSLKQVLAEVKTWMDGDLDVWMKSLREMIQFVKNLASSRATTLKAQLDERVGPVLKIDRSKSETLRGE